MVVCDPNLVSEVPVLISDIRCTGNTDGSICINIQNGEVVSNIQLFQIATSSYVLFQNGFNIGFPPSAQFGVNVNILNGQRTLNTNVQGRYCITNLPAGKYILELYDGNMACEKTLKIEINQPKNLRFKYVTENIGCGSSSKLNYVLTITGGVAPYSAFLTRTRNGVSTPLPVEVPMEDDPENVIRLPLQMLSHQTNDTYTITVTDSNGCVVVEPIGPPPFGPSILAQIGAKSVSCYNMDDGEISVSISGGVPPYTVNIIGQVSTNVSTIHTDTICISDLVECNSSVTFTNLRKGLYTVNVESGDGCIFTEQGVEVSQPPRIDYDQIITEPVTCSGKANGVIRISNIRGAYLQNDVRRELFVKICDGPEGFCASPKRIYPESRTDYEDPTAPQSPQGQIREDILESTIPFPGFSGDPNIVPYDDPDTDEGGHDRTFMYRSNILGTNPFNAPGGHAITGTLPDTDVVFTGLPSGCYKICIEDEFGCGIVVEAFVACPAPTKFML